MSITQTECVFVALGIQHAMHMRHIVIYDLPRSTIFFHNISIKGMIFFKKNKLLNTKYVGYSGSKYRLRISLAHPRDCHFAHVQ